METILSHPNLSPQQKNITAFSLSVIRVFVQEFYFSLKFYSFIYFLSIFFNKNLGKVNPMRYYNIMDIKLQDIYIFITVSEFLSVTKAADFLYLSPSKISKSIKKLENLWGIILFFREKNKLILTPAGSHIYQKMGNIIRKIEKVIDEAVQEQQVKLLLRLGCHCLTPPDVFIVPLINAFKERLPNITFSVECRDNYGSLRKMLLSDELDLIFTCAASITPLPENIEWHSLYKAPLYIVANRQNKLAAKDELTLEDLKSAQFVLTSPATDYHTDFTMAACRAYGFEPNIYRYTANICSQITEVYLHPNVFCITSIKDMILDESRTRYWKIPNISMDMGFACPKNANKIVKNFIATAPEVLKYC